MSNRVTNAISLKDQDIEEDDLAREIMQVQRGDDDDDDYEDDYDEIVDGVPEDEALQHADKFNKVQLPGDGGSDEDDAEEVEDEE